MLIRYARKNETTQVKEMWGEAFGTDEPYFRWYFNTIYRPDRTLAAFDGRKMLASLQFAPYSIFLNNALIPATFLVGVVTRREHRGQGVGHTLLKTAIDHLSRTSSRIILLHTDIPDYYRPLGFCECFYLRELRFPAIEKEPSALWKQVDDEINVSSCERIYRAMCNERNGFILRSERDWKNFCQDLLTDRQAHIYQSPIGYALTWVNNGRFFLRELGYLNKSAMRDGLQFAQYTALKQGFDEVWWNAPHNTPLLHQCEERLLPWIMARVTDVPPDAPDEAVEATKTLLHATDPRLWISEIT